MQVETAGNGHHIYSAFIIMTPQPVSRSENSFTSNLVLILSQLSPAMSTRCHTPAILRNLGFFHRVDEHAGWQSPFGSAARLGRETDNAEVG